jgi:hypothetical protein
MKTALLTSAVLLALTLSGPGRAADLVTKAPPPPPNPSSGKFYVWLDGSYQSQGLPQVDLGFTHLVFPPGGPLNQNAGPVATFKPRVDGAGFNGTLGYAFTPGILPAYLGSNARIELAGSYVTASATQSNSTVLGTAALPGTVAFQHVNGALSFFLICGADPCPTATSLQTHYDAWRLHARAASDFAFGAVTVTPSVKIFGGQSKNEQTLNQVVNFVTLVGSTSLIENASERSRDIGSMLGVNGRYDINQWLSFNLGGEVGVAYRRINLFATDKASGSSTVGQFATDSNKTPFLANAEASLVAKPFARTAIKVFGGVTYDNRVAGIAAQNYTGVLFNNNPTTPVSVRTSAELGYSGGMGLIVALSP